MQGNALMYVPFVTKAYTRNVNLLIHMKTHTTQVSSILYANEAQCLQEILSRCENRSSTTENDRADNSFLQTSSSAKLSTLHSWEMPLIMNVRIQDDI